MKYDNSAGEIALGLIFGMMAVPWYAFTLAKLWLWFVVPLGMPVIGMAHVYGLVTLVSMPLIGVAWSANKAHEDKPVYFIPIAHGCATAVALAVGAITKGLIP